MLARPHSFGLKPLILVLLHMTPWLQPDALLAEEAPPPEKQNLPHLRIDHQQRLIDLEATVVMRQGQWLELLACTPGTREHEAILTVKAKPSHIHLALLLLKLEPGKPMQWRYEDKKMEVIKPTGPGVAVTILTRQGDQVIESPANEWVRNQHTNQPLQGNVWLFCGSQFRQLDTGPLYLADANGTVVSLVNFGDDLLGRDTDMTNRDDNETWATVTEKIPPVGTEVTLRLRPLPEAPATQPAPK